MIVTNDNLDKININNILNCLPIKIKKIIEEYIDNNSNNIINSINMNINITYLEEIRIRVNRPIVLKIGQDDLLIDYIVSFDEILEIIQHICDNSIYSFQNQICEGYITIKGGHRVGIAGKVVIKDNKVLNISFISSLNIRIAKQVLGASDKILPYIINNESIYNTLIISPPGAGKTTILRDIIRRLSNGISNIGFKGLNIGAVDERGELAAMYRGVPQNDLGIRTDILDGIDKALGIKMLIRSMSPKIIVADEIGKKEDVDAIKYAVCSGVKGIFTAHGESIEDIKNNIYLNTLIEDCYFDRIIILSDKISKGNIDKIYGLDKESNLYKIM